MKQQKFTINILLYFFTVVALLATHTSVAQNAQQYLNDAYRSYKEFNNIYEYRTQPLTESEAKNMTQKAEAALALFNKVIEDGETEQKLAAAYYTTLTLSQHGHIAYELGDYSTAVSDFNSCDDNMAKFVSNIFPLKFRIEGEYMQVDYYKFERYKTDHYYFSGLAYFRQKNMKECVDRMQRLISAGELSQERRYIAYSCMVFAQALEPALIFKPGQSYNAYRLIETYTPLTGYYEKKLFDDKTVLKPLDAAGLLIEYGNEADESSSTWNHCAVASMILMKTEPKNKTVLNLLELCYSKSRYYSSDKPYAVKIDSEEFYKMAHEYAQTMVEIDQPKAEFVGVEAIQSLSEIAEIKGLYGKDKKLEYPAKYKLLIYCADGFKFWNRPDKEARRRELAKECYKNMSGKQRKENGID